MGGVKVLHPVRMIQIDHQPVSDRQKKKNGTLVYSAVVNRGQPNLDKIYRGAGGYKSISAEAPGRDRGSVIRKVHTL